MNDTNPSVTQLELDAKAEDIEALAESVARSVAMDPEHVKTMTEKIVESIKEEQEQAAAARLTKTDVPWYEAHGAHPTGPSRAAAHRGQAAKRVAKERARKKAARRSR